MRNVNKYINANKNTKTVLNSNSLHTFILKKHTYSDETRKLNRSFTPGNSTINTEFRQIEKKTTLIPIQKKLNENKVLISIYFILIEIYHAMNRKFLMKQSTKLKRKM